MLDPIIAWAIVIVGYALPLIHIIASPAAGPWKPPPGSGCPFGPKTGWLVIVLLLGVFGWLMFMLSRRRRTTPR